MGIASVLCRAFSTLEDTFSTCGDNINTVGDNISSVEVIQYRGDNYLKYYEFLKNLEIFSRAYFASQSDRPHRRPQVLTTNDMVKDLGWYKNIMLGKIILRNYDRPGFWKYSVKFFVNCDPISEQFIVQGPSRATAILHSIQHLLRMNPNLVAIQSEQRERLEDECTTMK